MKEKGITLIALVITIIVLLILAGVTIATLAGENGIIKRADEATEKTKEANAEEQVKLAVLGSKDTQGKLNNEDLRDNLNQIEKIEGVPNQITDEDYPLTVIVDGYGVIIKADGTIKKPGKWKLMKENGETVITDGTTKLKIGDYVNYDPTRGGEIQETEQNGGKTYSYESPQGSDTLADGVEHTEKGNGYGNLYFSISADTGGWRVLGLDPETDEILLISAKAIKTIDNIELYLRGQTGVEWGEQELNEICAIYGEGNGATDARSITVQDINKITGYHPEVAMYGQGETYEYGKQTTYSLDVANPFKYYDTAWKSLGQGQNVTLTSTAYYYYPDTLTDSETDTTTGIDKESKEYEILFESEGKYWLASSYTRTYSDYADFGFYHVNSGQVSPDMVFHSNGTICSNANGVRPIVSLKADVSISGGDGSDTSTAYQIQDTTE